MIAHSNATAQATGKGGEKIMQFFDPRSMNWKYTVDLINRSYRCGYCSDKVSSNRGYYLGQHSDASGRQEGGLYICPNCQGPTFFMFSKGGYYPSPAMGNTVESLPKELDALYEEARKCTSQAAYNAAVMLCRKILMNIAVNLGEKEGLKFIEYVEYLSNKGYVPPNGKVWVDHIRKKGNEATHEIALMMESDAEDLLMFTEMLLRFIYEFPSKVPQSPKVP